MNMDRFNKWLRYLTIAALALNFLAIAAHYFILHQYDRHMSFPRGATVGPVSGISSDRIPVVDSGFQCHAIRYTSIHCPWCLKDESSWQEFNAALRDYGCDAIILAPTGADLPKNSRVSSNQRSVMAVAADVAARLDMLATPTTIVVDHEWKVAWSKAGILSPGDKQEALRSLDRGR